jgi:hypothetical protein
MAAVQRGELDCAYALSDDEAGQGLELRRLDRSPGRARMEAYGVRHISPYISLSH